MGTIVISTVQMWKLRHKDVKYLDHSYFIWSRVHAYNALGRRQKVFTVSCDRKWKRNTEPSIEDAASREVRSIVEFRGVRAPTKYEQSWNFAV